MKKVNCIVVFKYNGDNYILESITVKHKHNNTPLFFGSYRYYKRFNDMYEAVLNLLKVNNMYVHTWEEFNSKWYDIDFINIENYTVNRYSFY